MFKELLNKVNDLRKKQNTILRYVSSVTNNNLNIKPHKELSPLGWHLIHCVYIEAVWIRSKLLNENYIEKKLKGIADSTVVTVKDRGKSLPSEENLFKISKKIFTENIIILENTILKKSNKKKFDKLKYYIDFLNQHHAQHIENIKNILNIFFVKFGKFPLNIATNPDPKIYRFVGTKIKGGYYKIGSSEESFSYDNELPSHFVNLMDFTISINVLTVSEWLGFMADGGYKKKEFWTKKGWYWKCKYNILHPFNWKYLNKKKFVIATYNGFKAPTKNTPVSNISRFELKAFAKYTSHRLPHEYEWEAAFNKINNKFKVWEWSSNKFFGYEGFKSYPYKEYSIPWFNNNYYSLRGGSVYTANEIKRASFRNFYKPSTRYIMSGGRLCL